MRGDINATELYQDRRFLELVGLGILDVQFGSGGGVGFEDVRRFSYIEAEEEDPKLYRRKVFNLTGSYYPNDLAQALWVKFNEYQRLVQEQTGQSLSLEESANLWLRQYGHTFFKNWALLRDEVPFRMRNLAELRLGWGDLTLCKLVPGWRKLLEAGFSSGLIAWATLLEKSRAWNESREQRFVRVVARLSGLAIKDEGEAVRRLSEIENLARNLTKRSGDCYQLEEATLEYYRRLNLVAEIEGKAVSMGGLHAVAT